MSRSLARSSRPRRARDLTLLSVTALALLAGVWWPTSAARALSPPARAAPNVQASGVVLPADGPVVAGFDPPAQPYGPGHRGVDLAVGPGSPVHAALGGVVAFSGLVGGAGWVTVRHGGGLETTYGVLDPRSVRAGQRVRAGAVLGQLSRSAGHLDWGARLDGAYVDPLGLLGSWQIGLAPIGPRPSAGGGSHAAPLFDGVYAPPQFGPPGP